MKKDSLFATLARKAKSMTDVQLLEEYNWINPSHVTHMLKEIRHSEALRLERLAALASTQHHGGDDPRTI